MRKNSRAAAVFSVQAAHRKAVKAPASDLEQTMVMRGPGGMPFETSGEPVKRQVTEIP
ncbi:hypothetical protein ACRYCC_17545 [Actinomadura scrupuli]|uniref:hypothetical protein n=1 Tax=Actinomadura scrupuli TaxID=559629 RepID=UPI003D976B65